MTADPEVLARARAYASGDLSTLGLYEWLAGRGHPISDDLEAHLWGLAIAVDAGEMTLDDAQQWVAGNVEPQVDENTRQVRPDSKPFLNLHPNADLPEGLEIAARMVEFPQYATQHLSPGDVISLLPGAVVSIPPSGRITFETVQSFVADGPGPGSATESWWLGVERTPPLAVPA